MEEGYPTFCASEAYALPCCLDILHSSAICIRYVEYLGKMTGTYEKKGDETKPNERKQNKTKQNTGTYRGLVSESVNE